jgi:hypothetical protein
MTATASRRAVLAGMASLPAAPIPAIAAISEKNGGALTNQELAAPAFEPIPEFRVIGPEQREKHEKFLNNIAVNSRIAITLLGKTKPEMIEIMRNLCTGTCIEDDPATSMVLGLNEARKDTEALLKFLSSAEARAMSALGNLAMEEEAAASQPCVEHGAI